MHVISVVGSLASISGWIFGQETVCSVSYIVSVNPSKKVQVK